MNIRKIIITGPESTGKTTLCKQLAEHYNTVWVPEYARDYIESLNGKPYTFSDVEKIAQVQIKQLKADYPKADHFVFFDTGLIITKVWFQIVFGKVPDYITKAIITATPAHCLLCDTTPEWKSDPVRENSGSKRETLYQKYNKELIDNNIKFNTVTGSGADRFRNAVNILESAYSLHTK